jgi:hypothetical protein
VSNLVAEIEGGTQVEGVREWVAGEDVINHTRALKLNQIVKEFLEFYVKLIAYHPCKMLAAR